MKHHRFITNFQKAEVSKNVNYTAIRRETQRVNRTERITRKTMREKRRKGTMMSLTQHAWSGLCFQLILPSPLSS